MYERSFCHKRSGWSSGGQPLPPMRLSGATCLWRSILPASSCVENSAERRGFDHKNAHSESGSSSSCSKMNSSRAPCGSAFMSCRKSWMSFRVGSTHT